MYEVDRSSDVMVVGEGFEPSKSVTADLQSAPFGRSGTPPGEVMLITVSTALSINIGKSGRIIPDETPM